MPAFPAAALVFLSSAAVLVLEILAARLMAPYVGVTLEVYTAIIGVVLAGIAVGSWLGGRAADRVDPRGMIGPLLIVGGILAFLSLPLVDGLGGGLRGATAGTTTLLTFLGFFAPAAVLSAVTPAIIKLRLASLDETGRVVGRLSAISTAGAIVGTFITGFVLVAAWPSRPVVRVVAVSLVLLGIGVSLWLRKARPLSVGSVIAAVLAGLFSFAASHPCEHESAYYCAYIEQDPERESGRALWLDTLRHSYVDLEDPSHLEFTYMQWFGDVLTALAPDGEPLEVLHVGGAGFTMPQYLREEHPGSTSTVLELDELLVELARRQARPRARRRHRGADRRRPAGDPPHAAGRLRRGDRRRVRRRGGPLAPHDAGVPRAGRGEPDRRRRVHDEPRRLRRARLPARPGSHGGGRVRPRRRDRRARLLRPECRDRRRQLRPDRQRPAAAGRPRYRRPTRPVRATTAS
jgi:MFS family permease